MWPDFCAGRGFNHVRFDKMHDYVVNLDKGERIVLAYTKHYRTMWFGLELIRYVNKKLILSA